MGIFHEEAYKTKVRAAFRWLRYSLTEELRLFRATGICVYILTAIYATLS